MRTVHRIIAIVTVAIMLFIAVTGTWMQLLDMGAVYGRAGALDPTMRSIREGLNGEPNYSVKRTTDFFARPLPADLDTGKALATVVTAFRTAHPDLSVRYAELAQEDGRTIGRIRSTGTTLYSFDAATGAPIGVLNREALDRPPENTRENVKQWHRMWVIGPNVGTFVNFLCGLLLWVLIVTGLVHYWRLYKLRRKIKKPRPFWSAGGQMRTWHRGISVAASIFILMMAGSGTLIAFESAFASFNHLRASPVPGMTLSQWGMNGDHSKPLSDAEVQRMATATLAAYRKGEPDTPILRLRLRQFGAMPQGVVITGPVVRGLEVSSIPEPAQLVYDTRNGARASLTEAGYPFAGFPFGVQAHEDIKQFHRGDLMGMPGRWTNLLSGLALLFLCVSGIVMYVDMWAKRRTSGRSAFFWK